MLGSKLGQAQVKALRLKQFRRQKIRGTLLVQGAWDLVAWMEDVLSVVEQVSVIKLSP